MKALNRNNLFDTASGIKVEDNLSQFEYPLILHLIFLYYLNLKLYFTFHMFTLNDLFPFFQTFWTILEIWYHLKWEKKITASFLIILLFS